jgi:uncharacterized protein
MSHLFEFDTAKSASNKIKHGIDFNEAQRLWADDKLLVAGARFGREQRWIAIGLIADKLWTAVFTHRDNALRIISVRRARNNEIENYYGRRT